MCLAHVRDLGAVESISQRLGDRTPLIRRHCELLSEVSLRCIGKTRALQATALISRMPRDHHQRMPRLAFPML